MKKTSKKPLTCITCALIIASTLVSCASETDIPQKDAGTSQSTTQTETTTQSQGDSSSTQGSTPKDENNHDINIDTYKEQISYYMTLAETLEAELLKLKEENYIDECEYQLKISTLEDTIDMLKKTIASLSSGDSTQAEVQEPFNDSLGTRSEYKYTVKNGKITITAYTGSSLDVKIPSSINGMPVVAIGENAFSGMQIRSVVIPSGVKEIDWFAFSACTVLESVTVPSSVTAVGYGAFDYCPRSLKIICEKGSYIEAYAISWGMIVSAN